MGFAGVGQPEDQQRPVPEIQRIGHRPERHQRRGGQQAIGCRQPVTGRRVGAAVGRRQDHHHGCADRYERPRAGELLHTVDQRSAGQDGRQPEHCQQRAEPSRPVDEGHDSADEDTQQQLPGPGEAVVVGRHLIGLMLDHRVHERRHRQHGQHHHEGRSQAGAQASAQQRGQPQGQDQERDVELTLHRHRPDVLQGRDRLAGPQIVRGGRGQFPVLVVAQACQTLVGEGLPTGLGLDDDRDHRRGGEHHDQSGQQSARESLQVRPRRERRPGPQRRTQQRTAEEETRESQEDVDAAGHPAEPDVEDRHQRDRHPTQSVEVLAIDHRALRGSRRMADRRRSGCRRRAGKCRGGHIRRPIYLPQPGSTARKRRVHGPADHAYALMACRR